MQHKSRSKFRRITHFSNTLFLRSKRECFLLSLLDLRSRIWSWHVATVSIRGNKASIKHRLDGLFVLLVGLLSSLDFLELDMETIDSLKLVLNCLLFGKRGGLLIFDFLLGSSSYRSHLHSSSKDGLEIWKMESKIVPTDDHQFP